MTHITIEKAKLKQWVKAVVSVARYAPAGEGVFSAVMMAQDDMNEVLKQALAAPPVQELQRYSPNGEGGMEVDTLGAYVKHQDVSNPPAAPVPEGMVLVPMEPTKEMVFAGQDAWSAALDKRLENKEPYGEENKAPMCARVAYRAMLAAAPEKGQP
jgi:hypothetical protein